MADYVPPASVRPVDPAIVIERLETYSVDEQLAFSGTFLEEAIEFTQRLAANAFIVRSFIDRAGSIKAAESGFTPPQTFHLMRTKRFGIRVNVWPKSRPTAFANIENALFSYDLGHNHDFDFVTVGYFGPGYDTDLGVIDPEQTRLPDGSPLEITDRSTKRLIPGAALAFRAYSDVHSQHQPDDMSISINLLSLTKTTRHEQVLVDMDRSLLISRVGEGEVGRVKTVLDLATAFPTARTDQIMAQVAEHHPRESVRDLAAARLTMLRDRPRAFA